MSKPFLQRQFEQFYDVIRTGYDESDLLRSKRDLLIDELKRILPDIILRRTGENIAWSWFNQGSYSTYTGVLPLVGEDYDLDLGIVFKLNKDHFNPAEVKDWVHEALNTNYFRTVEMKTPCVRAQYFKDFLPWYHIDMAVYSHKINWWENDVFHLARGRRKYGDVHTQWEEADPKALIQKIRESYSDFNKRAQFRRCIRYLKRWKDNKFKHTKDGRPTGIALTVCGLELFSPKFVFDWSSSTYLSNDLQAIRNFVAEMINQFGWNKRMKVYLPVKPYNDLCDRMTDIQMSDFLDKLKRLRDALDEAKIDAESDDEAAACRILRRQFGEDFPIMTSKYSSYYGRFGT
jgi:hypothetical protein